MGFFSFAGKMHPFNRLFGKYNSQFIKSYLFLLISLFFSLLMNTDVLYANGIVLIKLEKSDIYRESDIRFGERIEVIIDGVGWYLNRYDTEHLKRNKRVLSEDSTIFYFETRKIGIGYIIFSYMDKDIYVKVNIIKDKAIEKKNNEEVKISQPIVEMNLPTPNEIEDKKKNEKVELSRSEYVEAEKKESKPLGTKVIEKTREKKQETKSENREIKRPNSGPTESAIFYTNNGKIKEIPAEKGLIDYFNEGKKFFNSGSYNNAVESLRMFLKGCKDCPERLEAELLLGKALESSGKEEDAISYYKKVIGSSNGTLKGEAAKRIADIQYRQNMYKEALEYYLIAEREKVGNNELIGKIADICYQLKDYEKALNYYLRLYSKGEKNDKILYRIATIYDMPGDLKNIEKAFFFYNLVVENFEKSEYIDEAMRKVEFYKKYFFEYR